MTVVVNGVVGSDKIENRLVMIVVHLVQVKLTGLSRLAAQSYQTKIRCPCGQIHRNLCPHFPSSSTALLPSSISLNPSFSLFSSVRRPHSSSSLNM